MTEAHERRSERVGQAYKEANARFMARLATASAEEAQIAWHVARVTDVFADLVEGKRPSEPVAAGFRERPWAEIAASIPGRLTASRGVSPPDGVQRDDVVAALSASEARLLTALQALTAERGAGLAITHPAVGTVTLYQLAEWATAHIIRHNQQLKRVLGR